MSAQPTQALFVTGTDTDAGKTLVCCALLEAWRAMGLSVLGIKPVAAGVEKRGKQTGNADALALQEHSSGDWSYEQINPILLDPPIAPHLAAAEAKVDLSVQTIMNACAPTLQAQVDRLLVEGVGGWKVPLTETETTVELAKAFNFPVLLVVHMRLGCLNHALLTVESIQAQGLRLAGWVANVVSTMPYQEENIDTLRKRISVPCWGVIPPLTKAQLKDAHKHLDAMPRTWQKPHTSLFEG